MSERCACHTKASRGPAAPTRAAAPPGATRKPAAAQRRPRAPQLLQEALCTAPAARKPASEALCTAPTRAAAPPGGSVYCACHAKGSQEAPRVLRLPHESQPRPSDAHARCSSSRRLCGLRLPRKRQPGSSLYCACHTKPAAAQRRPRAPQLLHKEALCTAPATRKAARKLSVLRLPREASRGRGAHARRSSSRRLCVLRLPRERQPGSSLYCRGPAAPTRAAAPPGGSVYCACHVKLRLPRETVPATRSGGE